MKQFCTLCSLLFLWGTIPQLYAQADCANAQAINTGGTFTATFDNTADFLTAYNGGTAPNNGQYTCAATPGLGDVWFTYSPGGSNLVQNNIRLRFSPNFNGTFNIFLFYSESFEIGDPCEFPGGNVLTGLTRYQEFRCNAPINAGAGNELNLDYNGLDGSGQYLIVVERVSGVNGGGPEQMTITATLTGTCPAPANDACANPSVLTVGNGIDPGYNSPNVAAWTDAIKGTNACATKERLFDQCSGGLFGNPPTPTEDHYGAWIGIGSTCVFTGNLGDNGNLTLGIPGHADQFLENTVYFQFTIPGDATSTTWYLNLGSNGFCSTEPNDMAVMVFSNLDCNDADNSTRIMAQKMNVSPSLPTPLHTFTIFGATPGNTYYVVVDGTRGSQCDFCMLLSTNIVNPVLPATVENFDGWNQGPQNVLNWETSLETQHDYFQIERSLDGENFSEIGYVAGVGESNSTQDYNFVDVSAPFGKAFYRLAIVDINGGSYYSSIIEVTRDDATFGLHEVYPVPFRNELIVNYSTESEKEMLVRLYDMQGRLVLSETAQPKAGTNRFNLQTEAVPSGMYILRLEQNGLSQIKKVIK
ncbi:MAG: T9SS type A sorting domain-containing protein [Bacteroidota bacterium]